MTLPPPSPNPTARAALQRVPAWAEVLTRLLDNAFVIPGTNIRVGLDALLGLVAPGAGDAVGGFASLALLYLGFQLRVPKVVLLRMLLNIGLDALIGAVPLLGDVFDVFYRASDRNLALLKKHLGQATPKPALGDYAVVGLALLVAVFLLALPFVVAFAFLDLLVRFMGR